MQVKTISKEKISGLLQQLLSDYDVIAPATRRKGLVKFEKINDASEVSLDYHNTDIAPKGFFFPQTENLFKFHLGEGDIDLTPVEDEEKERILFGTRPCDIRALETLDPVFAGPREDNFYLNRREQTIIIGLACQEVLPTCFCNAFGISPVDAKGADIMLLEQEGNYLITENTERGRSLVEKYQNLFTTREIDLETCKENLHKKLQGQFIHQLSPAAVKKTLDLYFDLPYWEQVSPRCLGCGICTYICPTCHCFDIFDFTPGGTEGGRYRCWDSCMFKDFTKMAGGHNPRPTKKERVRNRFMHKLKYHLDRYGLEGCVGCGRCIAKCPVNIDITRIIADLEEVE